MAYGHHILASSGLMPRRNLLLPTLCIVLLITIWTFRFPATTSLDLQWFDSPPPPTSLGPPKLPGNEIDLSDPEAPFVGWPLQRLCSETTWVEGLAYICDNNSGGIGNIRNYIQTCLRYALEAGATSLVIPKIRKRNEHDLADLFTGYLPFSYMFDEQRFRSAFNDNCPQITLYDNPADIPGAGAEPNIELITPKDFGNREGCDWQDQNRHTDRFGDKFRHWLNHTKNIAPPSEEHPRLIRFNWGVLWDWQVYRDGPEFASTFGSILKFNDQLLRLGRLTLKNMHAYAQAEGNKQGKFLGVHLRTESDALGFWPTYDVQSEAYLKQARKRGYETAYLATGNMTEAIKFAGGAVEMAQMKVITKTDLLKGEDLEELQSLSWDQQGLVDFIVLLGSDFFVGTMPSSFSVYMAMKRHLKTGGLYTRPYKVGTEGDGLSYLVGNYDKYWQGWLFMWDGMWPLERITASKLADILLAAQQSPDAKKLAIVDVRDDDYIGGHIKSSLHFPSRSLDATMPTLRRRLQDVDTVVFHCALSQQRGPGAALRYLREKADDSGGAEGKKQKVCVLDRGFVGWQEIYGTDDRLTEGYRKEVWEEGY
ncbi:hypothetical protein F5Y15DRAFT_409686 [Xylariaceae sp. FL0016]|nr:hypothetical protein F5Y15DRAFT_409686 [Xylariaceae sp. FL0016]